MASMCATGWLWRNTWMRCCWPPAGASWATAPAWGDLVQKRTASERTNKQVVEAICIALDLLLPAGAPHSQLITRVTDRPGHDRRYAIDPNRISTELGWQPRHSFDEGLAATVAWHLKQQGWCRRVREQGGDSGGGPGVLAGA
jgi:dTDP-D-glucose 4,6-dehydratase